MILVVTAVDEDGVEHGIGLGVPDTMRIQDAAFSAMAQFLGHCRAEGIKLKLGTYINFDVREDS